MITLDDALDHLSKTSLDRIERDTIMRIGISEGTHCGRRVTWDWWEMRSPRGFRRILLARPLEDGTFKALYGAWHDLGHLLDAGAREAKQ